jgi:4-amino-4-deoxy-L-arabinose transferase-like glycosyltransferase
VGAWSVIKRRRDRFGNMDGRVVYLLLWILIPLLFFTLSQSKRPQYVLPLVPAIALLAAAAWNSSRGRLPGVRFAAAGTALLGIFFLVASRSIPDLVPASTTAAQAIPGTALVLGIACLFAGLLAWLTANRLQLVLVAFAISVAAVPLASRKLMDAIGADRSAAAMAQMIESAVGSDARVVGVRAFPLSLPFYLQSTVLLATDDGSELTSNYIIRHFDDYAGSSTLRAADWWRSALVDCTRPTVFVIGVDDSEARELLRSSVELLIETRKYAVYGPCGVTNLALVERG